MRVVAYLCLVCCLLSFNIHANSAPLIIKQGIEKQTFTVAITNEAKPIVEFEIEEDGLLIIEVKQRGHFLYERLWIDGKPQAYMDMFGFSEGSDFVSKQVSTGEKLGIEIKSSTNLSELTSIDLYASIVSNAHHQFDIFTDLFLVLNQLALKTQQAYTDSGSRFKTLVNETYQLNTQAIQQLSQLPQYISTKNYLFFNQAVLMSDLGQRKASFDKFSTLLSLKKGKSVELLSNYYVALLLPDYLEKDELLTKLDKAIIQAKGYNSYLYQNSRMDKCTALQQQSSPITTDCISKIIAERLLEGSPLKLAVLQTNLAQLYFSQGKFIQSVEFGNKGLESLEKINNIPEQNQVYMKKKAIFEYQQAIRLNLIGLENEALVKYLSSTKTLQNFEQYEFKFNSLIELSNLYLKASQPEIAHFIIKYVLKELGSPNKSDHFHLYKNAYLIAFKTSVALKNDLDTKLYFEKLKQLKKDDFKNLIEYQVYFAFLQYQSTPTMKQSEALLKLISKIKTFENISSVLLLRLTEFLITTDQHNIAKPIISVLKNRTLPFKSKVDFLVFSSMFYLNKNDLRQADDLIRKAIISIEKQYNQLNNIGLKRNYFATYSQVFHTKTRILISFYEKTKDDKYLYEASQLNLPHIERYRQNQFSQKSQIERQRIASELSHLNIEKDNAPRIITKLLALETEHLNLSRKISFKGHSRIPSSYDSLSATILHYVLMPDRSLVFIYSKNNISFKWLPAKKTINKLISNFFIATNNNRLDDFEIAKKLSNLLIPHQLKVVSEKQHLSIIGSGLTWQLPFGVLPISYDKGWNSTLLIDKFILSKALSLDAISKLSKIEITSAVSVFDPVFSINDVRAQSIEIKNTKKSTALTRIKSGQVESNALESSNSDMKITKISGFSATKQKFIEELAQQSPQLIHIASHGFSSPNNYRNAGIHFSSINQNGELLDDILKLTEIELLNNHAELVVLSACESNVGKTNFKSPVDGIAIAFLSAGAQKVIATQWKVPSRASARLISDFYNYMVHDLSLREALHKAQLNSRKRYKLPKFWAGYTLISH